MSNDNQFSADAFIQALDTMSSDELAQAFVDLTLQKSLLEFSASSAQDRKEAATKARQLKILLAFIKTEDDLELQSFLRACMKKMSEAARAQDAEALSEKTVVLYRAFDQMDEILGIQYTLDLGMGSDPNQTERLYEGAGIGVQTSYSSILLALDRANPKQGATVLDLGSGYGRVGFVIGLLRPDIKFQGFEYVDHRVQDSKNVAASAKLTNIEFVTQDLSLPEFKIPAADVYYMYDPFSRETYGYVLDQLLDLGKTNDITIITKGRANTWVKEALEGYAWSVDDSCDSGTVSVFRSPAKSPAPAQPT